MQYITGIGGIFFKSQDPEAIKAWYRQHFGLPTDQWGHLFAFHPLGEPDKKAYLQWSAMSADTDYYEPGRQEFMINYRVRDLEKLIEQLREQGVTVVGDIQTFDYGKFAHVMDPDGRKIELWEPVDETFDSPAGD